MRRIYCIYLQRTCASHTWYVNDHIILVPSTVVYLACSATYVTGSDPPNSIVSPKLELRRFLIGWFRERSIVVQVLSYLLLSTWTFEGLALFHTSALFTPPPSVPIESPTTILLD